MTPAVTLPLAHWLSTRRWRPDCVVLLPLGAAHRSRFILRIETRIGSLERGVYAVSCVTCSGSALSGTGTRRWWSERPLPIRTLNRYTALLNQLLEQDMPTRRETGAELGQLRADAGGQEGPSGSPTSTRRKNLRARKASTAVRLPRGDVTLVDRILGLSR